MVVIKSEKRILKIVFFITLIIMLSGCVNENSGAVPEKENVETEIQDLKENLTFRITWKTYSGRGETIRKIVDSFNLQNETEYNINTIDGDEDLTKIEELLRTDDVVDIYVLPYRYVQSLGNDKQLDNLTNFFNDSKDLFYPELWNLGVVDQKLFGIPWMGHSMGLIYNKDLLKKAGVNPGTITSVESLITACKKIEEKTDAKGFGLVGANHNDVSWMVNQFIYGFGGSLVSDDGTEVVINSDASKSALEFYKNELGNYAQNSWTEDTGLEVMEYFRKQEIAFEIQGLWGVTDIWKTGNNFETGVIPLERIGLLPEVGPMMIALQPGLSEGKKLTAVAFIKYLISVEAQEMIMMGEYSIERDSYYPFRLPVRKDIAQSSVFDTYPEFVVFLSGFEHPSIDVPVPMWQVIKDDLYAPYLHKVMRNEISIDDFLKMIEDKGNQILLESN